MTPPKTGGEPRHQQRANNFCSYTSNLAMLFFLIVDVVLNKVHIYMGTNGVVVLVNVSFYSYEADFIQKLLKKEDKLV